MSWMTRLMGFPNKEISQLKRFTNSIGMTFELIPAGTFMMGSPESELDRISCNEIRHRVTLSKAFYLQTTQVTQGQWKRVMKENPSFLKKGDDYPVQNVSWMDCLKFIGALNMLEGTTRYRLPTEAEWEYACRAGSKGAYCYGDGAGRLHEFCWFYGNSGGEPRPVGGLKPNAWGLYDMHGNVDELCQDWIEDYPDKPVRDPLNASGSSRVTRGGDCYSEPDKCRSASRVGLEPNDSRPYIGVRLAGTP